LVIILTTGDRHYCWQLLTRRPVAGGCRRDGLSRRRHSIPRLRDSNTVRRHRYNNNCCCSYSCRRRPVAADPSSS